MPRHRLNPRSLPLGTSGRLRVWALWLVLVLAVPLAQVASSAHGLSHLGGADAPKHAVHGQPCDQCVASAHLAAAAPTTAHACGFTSDLGHVAPADPDRAAGARAPTLAYRSRAPPVFLR